MLKPLSLLASLTLSVSSIAASAPVGETFNAAGVAMYHVEPGAATAVPAIARPTKGTVIYSNFNSDMANLYNCCWGYTVRGAATDEGYQRVAMAFTPATDTHLRRVNIALSHAGWSNRLIASLQEDDNGLPGNVIREFVLADLPEVGTCCDTEAMPGKAIPLQAGKTYWIVATPKDMTGAVWNLSNTGGGSLGAYDGGAGWQALTDMQGAFAVIGD